MVLSRTNNDLGLSTGTIAKGAALRIHFVADVLCNVMVW